MKNILLKIISIYKQLIGKVVELTNKLEEEKIEEKIEEELKPKVEVEEEPKEIGIPIRKLAEAMAGFEGFYLPNSIARKNNNPVNLRWSHLQTMTRGGFAFFPTKKIGWKGAIYDLSNKCQGKTKTNLTGESTIRDLIYVWAPVSDNNPHNENYIKYVGDKLKVDPYSYKLKNFIL